MQPTRTAPTGPMKGSGEIISAADAPLMHRMSCAVRRSAERTVQITCTSFLNPLGQSGLIGRSICRAVRIARSVGRPSRLKKPPGIFPAAYIRSSTSTVSGKKSAPSRASVRPCAVESTIVSPERTTTAPSACFASLPLSKMISWPPTVTLTVARRSVAIAISPIPPLCSREWGLERTSAAALARISTLFGLDPVPGFSLARACLDSLAPEPQLLDEGPVALQVVSLEIVQKPAAAADELEQPATRVVILRMRPQMLGELVDARREERDLNLRRARVRQVAAVLLDDLLLGFLCEGQVRPPCRRFRSPSAPRRKDAYGRGCGRE